MENVIEINPHFDNFIFDWNYKQYLLLGAYGSGKSDAAADKIIFKLLEESNRKCLVLREVFETLRESCYDLIIGKLEKMGILWTGQGSKKGKVVATESPMRIKFPNRSVIIFKGMDKPRKLKSITNVTIVWVEECAEVKYEGILELLLRLRHPTQSIHFIFTTNPVGFESWVYKHYFKDTDDDGKEKVVVDEERLYNKRILVKNGVYYHHSIPEDNTFLRPSYIQMLEGMKDYDPDLYRVARHGRFGARGRRVLPQFVVAKTHASVIKAIRAGGADILHFNGMDFGFEESYNAILRVAVNKKTQELYIYWEYYENHQTDDELADEMLDMNLKAVEISADNEDAKAIAYLRKRGLNVRKCRKYNRIDQVRKMKRFKKIVCSPKCLNAIKEMKHLTYKQDRDGKYIYDQFNIDPHTFSALWYALDHYDVVDIKTQHNTKRGQMAA